MRRLLLTVALLLMGVALIGAAAAPLVGSQLQSLAQAVGTTSASPAGAVLGLGLVLAAFSPAGNRGWVLAGIVYGLVVVGFEAAGYFLRGAAVHVTPIIVGLLFSLLLIATYPQRKKPAAAPAAPTSLSTSALAPATPAPASAEPAPATADSAPESEKEEA